jgi:hypothetical protein
MPKYPRLNIQRVQSSERDSQGKKKNTKDSSRSTKDIAQLHKKIDLYAALASPRYQGGGILPQKHIFLANVFLHGHGISQFLGEEKKKIESMNDTLPRYLAPLFHSHQTPDAPLTH